MTTLSINLLRWNTPWDEIKQCIDAVLQSTYVGFTLTYTENFHATAPSLMRQVQAQFGSDPRLHMERNDQNLGYAGAHNRFFAENQSELLMVLNPDAILDAAFLKNIVLAFLNPAVGAATGKMLKPAEPGQHSRVLDGTGIQIFRTRRARERGQLEVDSGQYDKQTHVFGVSGTAAVYRRSALEAVKLNRDEYFDTDFFAYWEDFDLSWRLRLKGFECLYVPDAVVEHTRAIGVSPGGLKKFTTFVRHHRSFPLHVRQWSWRNHLFAILKNDFGWPLYKSLPRILFRELALLPLRYSILDKHPVVYPKTRALAAYDAEKTIPNPGLKNHHFQRGRPFLQLATLLSLCRYAASVTSAIFARLLVLSCLNRCNLTAGLITEWESSAIFFTHGDCCCKARQSCTSFGAGRIRTGYG